MNNLTQKEVKRLFNYNQDDGRLFWRISPRARTKAETLAGHEQKYSNTTATIRMHK